MPVGARLTGWAREWVPETGIRARARTVSTAVTTWWKERLEDKASLRDALVECLSMSALMRCVRPRRLTFPSLMRIRRRRA